LGKSIGKQSAHEVVYEDAMKSFEESISFKQVLLNDNRVGEHLTGSQIDRLLDPSNYVGLAPQMAKEMVALTLKEREADNS
jgi:adenylosuccinate lyase